MASLKIPFYPTLWSAHIDSNTSAHFVEGLPYIDIVNFTLSVLLSLPQKTFSQALLHGNMLSSIACTITNFFRKASGFFLHSDFLINDPLSFPHCDAVRFLPPNVVSCLFFMLFLGHSIALYQMQTVNLLKTIRSFISSFYTSNLNVFFSVE